MSNDDETGYPAREFRVKIQLQVDIDRTVEAYSEEEAINKVRDEMQPADLFLNYHTVDESASEQ